jgi:hypothetical protein
MAMRNLRGAVDNLPQHLPSIGGHVRSIAVDIQVERHCPFPAGVEIRGDKAVVKFGR